MVKVKVKEVRPGFSLIEVMVGLLLFALSFTAGISLLVYQQQLQIRLQWEKDAILIMNSLHESYGVHPVIDNTVWQAKLDKACKGSQFKVSCISRVCRCSIEPPSRIKATALQFTLGS